MYLAPLFVGALAAAAYLLPLHESTEASEIWIAGHGPTGYLIFAAVYGVATLLLIPAGVFTVAAGALFGFGWGVLVVLGSGLASAIAAFAISRHLLRDRVKRHLARNEVLAAVDKCLRLEGWPAVALLRLSPFATFAVKNYCFGVSKVKFRDYVIGTALGKLPGVLIFVGLGATGRAAMAETGALKWGMLLAGILATFVATWLIGRTVKARLDLLPA